jgi:lysophospholipase L1-like esterase
MNLHQTSTKVFSLTMMAILCCVAASQALTTICCAGNSVTMTSQYPETLQALLGSEYKVYNEGHGGASVSSYPTTAEFSHILSVKPDIITIKLGCNDVHSDSSGLAGAYGTSWVQNYNNLIDQFEAIVPKPRVYIVLPAPVYPTEYLVWCDNMQVMIIPLARKLAAQRGLSIIDINTPLLNGPQYFTHSVHCTPGEPASDTMAHVFYRAIKGIPSPTPTRPQLNQVTSIAYGNGRYVAVENVGTISSSTDGTNWTKQYSDTVYPLHSVTYGNNQFIAVGWNGRILGSADGTNWTVKTSGTKESFFGIGYGNNQFVTVGGGYGGAISKSANGNTWTASNIGNIAYPQNMWLIAVAYGNGSFVAVGSSGQILTSADGIAWTAASYTAAAWLTSVIYANNQFVAVGQNPYNQNAIIATSTNGTDWVQRSSGTTNGLWSVAYGNNQYIAVGANGTILASTDGISWTKKSSGTTKYLSSITYGNSQFVVGGYGIILTINGGAVRVASQTRFARSSEGRIAFNTASNSFSIVVFDKVERNQELVRIFNTSGQRVFSAETRIQNGICTIPAGGFSTGKYFISITDGKRSLLSSDFVLTR